MIPEIIEILAFRTFYLVKLTSIFGVHRISPNLYKKGNFYLRLDTLKLFYRAQTRLNRTTPILSATFRSNERFNKTNKEQFINMSASI